MKQHYNIAIVGAGLAGSTMAALCRENGLSVCLIDEPTRSHCSRIAAGIFNPIVFKRTTLSWNALETLTTALAFYARLERSSNHAFLHHTPIQRVFSDFEEQNEWERKSAFEHFKPFIGNHISGENTAPSFIKAPFGTGLISYTGWIDTALLIETVKTFFVQPEHCLNESFAYNALQKSTTGYSYKNFDFDTVVFCEGHLVKENPFFSFIPLYPVKGEVLQLHNPGLDTSRIISGGVYLVPVDNSCLKIGATYDWENLNEVVTTNGLMELQKKVAQFYTGALNVTHQFAGIRPASKDRKPIVGKHPQMQNMFVLNGLGTKGVSLAPWCAHHLLQLIRENKPVPADIDVSRFYS